MSEVNTTVSNAADDLADLGLSLDTATPVANTEAVDTTSVNEAANQAAADEEKKTRKAVTLGEVVASEEPEELEDIKRGGGGTRESKYDFSDIKAPVNKAGEGEEARYAYYSKTYKPGEGTEVDELDRSVKSAATGANRANRKSGAVERYSTRAVVENGKQVGTKVVRVDDTTGIDKSEK